MEALPHARVDRLMVAGCICTAVHFPIGLTLRKGLRRATFCVQKWSQKQRKKAHPKIPNQRENYQALQQIWLQTSYIQPKVSEAIHRRRNGAEETSE